MRALVLIFVFCVVLPLVASQECSALYSSACAVRNTMNLATMVYNDVMKATTPTQLQNIWHEITWGSKYRISGGFYAWIFDWADHCKAHGGNPMNAGIELTDIINRDNFYTNINIGAILRGAAEVSGGSWVRYQWAENANDYVMTRRAWVRKFTLFNIDYYLGVAYVDTDFDWMGMPCMQTRAHFCSAENSKNLADAVAFTLINACKTGSDVDQVLESINNQSKFRLRDGYYTAVTLFNGPVVANGFNRNFVGKTVQGVAQYLRIFDYVPANLHEQLRFVAQNHTSGWVSHPWTNILSGSTVDTYTYSIEASVLNTDYYVTSGFENIVDPLCPNCNCLECKKEPVCEPCAQPKEEVVTSINFSFKQLTCAGDNC